MPKEQPPKAPKVSDMEKAELEQELKTIEKAIKFAKTREILEKCLIKAKGKSFESQVKKAVAVQYDALVARLNIKDNKKDIKKFKESYGVDEKSLAALSDEPITPSASPEPVAIVAATVENKSPEQKIADELAERGFSKKSLGPIVKKYGPGTEKKLHASGKTYEEYKNLKPAEKKEIFETVAGSSDPKEKNVPIVDPELKNTDVEIQKLVLRYHYLNDMLFGKDSTNLSPVVKAALQKEWDEFNFAHTDIVKAENARYGVSPDGFRMNSEKNWQELKELGYTAQDAIKWTKYEYETILNNKIKKGEPIPVPVAPKVKAVEPAGKILSPEQAKAQLDLKDRGFPYEYVKSLPEDSQKNLAASNFVYQTFQKLSPSEQSEVFRGEKKFETISTAEALANINKNYEVTDGDLDRILSNLDYDNKTLKGMNREEKMSAAEAILEGGLTMLGYTKEEIDAMQLRRKAVIVRMGTKKEEKKVVVEPAVKTPVVVENVSTEKALKDLKKRGFDPKKLAKMPADRLQKLHAWGGSIKEFGPMSSDEVNEKIFNLPLEAIVSVAAVQPKIEKTERKKFTEEGDVNFVTQKLFGYDEERIKRMPLEQKKNDIKMVLESSLLVLGYTPEEIEKMSLLGKFVVVENGIKRLEDRDLQKKIIREKIEALDIPVKTPLSAIIDPASAATMSEAQKLDNLVARGFSHRKLAEDKFFTSEKINQLYLWGGTYDAYKKMSEKEQNENIFGIQQTPVSPVKQPDNLPEKKIDEALLARGFGNWYIESMSPEDKEKIHAWGGTKDVYEKMSQAERMEKVFGEQASLAPTGPSLSAADKKIYDDLLALGISKRNLDMLSPVGLKEFKESLDPLFAKGFSAKDIQDLNNETWIPNDFMEKLEVWGGTRAEFFAMSLDERKEKVFGIKPPVTPSPTQNPPTPVQGPTVPPVIPPQGPRPKTPAEIFEMTSYGASYLDKATGTIYFVEHASQQKDGSVLLECRLSNGGKGMLRQDKLLHGLEIGAYERVDQQRFLEEQVNTTRTIYATEYKDNLNSSWWKKGVVRPLAGLGESLGLWRRDNKAFLSKEGESAKERYDAAKQELAKFADKRVKEKIVDPARIKRIEDGLKRRAAAKGEKITDEELAQEVNAILARYRRTILGHGIAIAETRKVHETQKGLFRSTTAETIGKAVKWYGGLSKASKFGIRAGVYTLAGISGMGAAAALGYGIYRGAKSVAMSGLIAQGTHLYRATIDKALVGLSDSSIAKKKQTLQNSIEKGQINILDYEKQMSNLGLKKNKHDAMRRTAQVGVAFALGWESYKVLDQIENTDWTTPPTPIPDDTETVPPAPLPEPHPFHLDRPTVEFSSKGAIRTFLELKENLKDQLEDQHIALNDPNLPPSVKEILNGDPTELAIKYDYYNPADTNESALLTLHGKLGFDENMNLVHMEPNGENTILADGHTGALKEDFGGKYIDSDYGKNIETKIGSPEEELEKMKLEAESEGVPINTSPEEELKTLTADKLTPDEILAKSMGVDHVDTVEFDGTHANGSFIFKYDADNNITGGGFEGDFKPMDLTTSPYLRSGWQEIVKGNTELPFGEAEEKLKESLSIHATLEDARANLPKTPDYDDERHYLDEQIKKIDESIKKDFGPIIKTDLSQAQYEQVARAHGRTFITADAENIFGNKMKQWDELARMPANVAMEKIYDGDTDLYDSFSGKQVAFIEQVARPLILEGNTPPLGSEDFATYLARLEGRSAEVAKVMADQYNLRA